MAHIHDMIDFTAEVFIVHQGKVLLRKHDKYKIWLSVGGHIELKEDPNQAVLREAKEEVGLDVVLFDTRTYHEDSPDYHELIAPRFLNRHRINESHEHVSLVYFGRSDTDRVTNDSDEVSDELRWFSAQELDDPQFGIIDRVRAYAKTALVEVV